MGAMSQGEHSRRLNPAVDEKVQLPLVMPTPTKEAWAAMSPAEQERVEVTLVEALTAEEQKARLAMPEGPVHYHTKEEICGAGAGPR